MTEKQKETMKEELTCSLNSFVLRVLEDKVTSDEEIRVLPEVTKILISLITLPC
jgi:hypothetical protein